MYGSNEKLDKYKSTVLRKEPLDVAESTPRINKFKTKDQ